MAVRYVHLEFETMFVLRLTGAIQVERHFAVEILETLYYFLCPLSPRQEGSVPVSLKGPKKEKKSSAFFPPPKCANGLRFFYLCSTYVRLQVQ